MTFRSPTSLARLLLAAALSLAVAVFVMSNGPQRVQEHGPHAAAMDQGSDHHSHTHDDSTVDQVHDERHSADHSHETPTAALRIVHTILSSPAAMGWLHEPAETALGPAPGDRPPQSLA